MLMETKIKISNKFGKFFAICFSIVALLLTITMADLFSSLITVGGFTFTNSNISLNKFTLYAVYTNTSTSSSSAQEQSNICKSGGGAGYIYMDKTNFYVIASIYESEEDAKKVLTNIKATHTNANVLELVVMPIELSSNLENKERSTLEEAINIFKNTYKKLYDISVSLDTSVINDVNAKFSINELGSTISKINSNFLTLFSGETSSDLLAIKASLSELAECLNELINDYNTSYYSSKIKETYCKTILIYKNLAENLQVK